MIAEVKRRQVVDQGFIETIRELLTRAERGEVVDIVVVANAVDEACFHRAPHFSDAWRLLGAIEYARQAVLNGMTEE